MTPERRKRTTLSFLILCGMLICGFFLLRHGSHRSAFTLAFYALLLLNSWLLYSFNANRRQPDTLTHLFPASPDKPKEAANS